MNEPGTIIGQLVARVDAEVIRGCCGRDHDFGPCPYADESKED